MTVDPVDKVWLEAMPDAAEAGADNSVPAAPEELGASLPMNQAGTQPRSPDSVLITYDLMISIVRIATASQLTNDSTSYTLSLARSLVKTLGPPTSSPSP